MTNLFMFVILFLYTVYNRAGGKSSGLLLSSRKNVSPSNLNDHLQQYSNSDQLFCFVSKEETCSFNCTQVICSENGPVIPLGCCATYNDNTRLVSFTLCANFLALKSYSIAKPGHILLPRNLSELNNYMCGPLNRQGLVCSECDDGFGPSVTSFGYKCANCTDAWYGVPLFLFLEFIPITVFYLIVLVFHISFTSAPMPCFVMYAQIITIMVNLISHGDGLARNITFSAENGAMRTDMKIIYTLFGVFNLDFFRLLFPPICISTRLKSLYVACFGYISVLYPLFLIFLTWICVDLHGCNFRPLVWLWRPFHGCFVRLRRGWDTKSDIVDVFATVFLLSYSKHIYQSLLMQVTQRVVEYSVSGTFVGISHRTFVDLSVTSKSKYLLLFTVPAAIISYIFILLPPLLLALYPIKRFRLFLSKCHLNFLALNIFVEKVHGCYRNGLDEGRDMRSFSGLYFFVRIVLYVTGFLTKKLSNDIWSTKVIWFSSGTVFFTTTLMLGLAQPYKKTYMNYADTLMLANLTLMCYVIPGLSNLPRIMVITRILLFMPFLWFVIIIMLKKLQPTIQNIKQLLFKCCRMQYVLHKVTSPFVESEESQPLIQST